jgi:hypothetical protein
MQMSLYAEGIRIYAVSWGGVNDVFPTIDEEEWEKIEMEEGGGREVLFISRSSHRLVCLSSNYPSGKNFPSKMLLVLCVLH